MIIKRIFVWMCDGCSLEAEKEGYGVPPGWDCVLEMGRPKHYCRHCVKHLKDNPIPTAKTPQKQGSIVNDNWPPTRSTETPPLSKLIEPHVWPEGMGDLK